MPSRHPLRHAFFVLALACLGAGLVPVGGAGATTTRTKPFARPPYYSGSPPRASTEVVRLAPVVRTTEHVPDGWIPLEALDRLATDLDAFLSVGSGSSFSIPVLDVGSNPEAPTIYFGCELDAIGECDRDVRQNVLATTGGTGSWRDRVTGAMRATSAGHALVLEVRLAPQWIHQKNLSGKKEVRLGTGNMQRLPWLTSLDTPVWVLQLTGAVVDAEGKVVRSGAEGLWAVRTPFRASVVRSERLMKDEEVEFVRTELAREDLPGRPLAWQAATRDLIRGLLAAAP